MKMFNKKRNYRITIEELDADNSPIEDNLVFEIEDHEDIFEVVNRLKRCDQFGDSISAPLGIGIRLFGGVMLKNKNHELFSQLMPHFREFMKSLKSAVKADT